LACRQLALPAAPSKIDGRNGKMSPPMLRTSSLAGWRAALSRIGPSVPCHAFLYRNLIPVAQIVRGALHDPIVGSETRGDLNRIAKVACNRDLSQRDRAVRRHDRDPQSTLVEDHRARRYSEIPRFCGDVEVHGGKGSWKQLALRVLHHQLGAHGASRRIDGP